MRDFLTSRRGKVIALITALVLLLGGLGTWKYVQDLRDRQAMTLKVNKPATPKMIPATMKKDTNIHRLTNEELLRDRKRAFRAGVDRYPNGYLKIPSIGVKLPIYNRANHLTLALGVGKDYYLDSKMGEGNFVLAGHNMEQPHVLLSDLSHVVYGNKIQLVDPNNHVYNYHVVTKRIASPYVTVVNGQPIEGSPYYLPKENEKPIVTVYTCTNGGNKRLVVQGELD